MKARTSRWLCIMLAALVAVAMMPVFAMAEAEKEHITIRWYQESRDLDVENDLILNAIEEKFNVSFEFIEPPSDGSSDKLNLMVATGEPIDWVTGFGIDQVAYGWAKDDFIYSYDELLEGKEELYPLVKKLVSAGVYEHLRVNDKSYFKPEALWAGNRGYVINKDWLDKLGLEIPTTIDEYYNVIKAFKEQDPDGNGQDDTYGFYVAEPYGSNSFGYISRGFIHCGAWGGDWVEKADGTITQFGLSDEGREAFRFITKCYDEDLFNKNFVNEIDAFGKVEDLMLQQKIGLTDQSQPGTLLGKMAEAGVDLNIAYLPPLTVNGEQGTLPHTGGYWSFHFIPRTCQNPDRVLEIMEWALTEEGREMTMFGLKDTHIKGYTDTDTMRIYELNYGEMSNSWNTSDYGFMYPLSWGGFNYCEGAYIPISDYETYDEAYANMRQWTDKDPSGTLLDGWYTNNAKYAKMMPLQGLIGESVQVPQTLTDIEIAGRTKAIVGGLANFDANWDEWTNLWLSQGGEALLESANAYYSANK